MSVLLTGSDALSTGTHGGPSIGVRPALPRFPHIFGLPLLFVAGLAVLCATPTIRNSQTTLLSFFGVVVGLCAWAVVLWISALRQQRTLTWTIVLLRQHYIQACAQGSVLLYWGRYWRDVYEFIPLIVGQLLFAYTFHMLLTWSRRDNYVLGFGPFPIVFSINLFLWFRPDWFYLQFLLVAIGFLAKEFIRWNRQGRSTHIFNPSAFPLAVFSVLLLLTNTSHLTSGVDIASTQFYPPHMYLMLFLIGLPGQLLFGVTTMTMAAVVTTYLFGLAYFAVTGIYFFVDSYIPIAVFLGMHLLFTDPSTSPRTELGRLFFGAMYGLGTVAAYTLLGRAGMPTYYDKLLPVPMLNLLVKLIDRGASSRVLSTIAPDTIGPSLTLRGRNLLYISVWAMVFVAMSATKAVGDTHPGQWIPFWERACDNGRAYACSHLGDMEANLCSRGSGWACNELAIGQVARKSGVVGAQDALQRGCRLGFRQACRNLSSIEGGSAALDHGPPALRDYPMLTRGSKGPNLERTPAVLYNLACTQGWHEACRHTGF